VVTIYEDSDPIDVGGQVGRQIHTAIGQRLPERQLVACPDAIEVRGTACLISNVGHVAIPPTPQGIQITALRFFCIPHAANPPNFFVTTVRGRLAVDLPYSPLFYTHEEMRQLASEVDRTIRRLAAR